MRFILWIAVFLSPNLSLPCILTVLSKLPVYREIRIYRTKGSTGGHVNCSYKPRIVGMLSQPDMNSSNSPSPALCTKGKGRNKNKRSSPCFSKGFHFFPSCLLLHINNRYTAAVAFRQSHWGPWSSRFLWG